MNQLILFTKDVRNLLGRHKIRIIHIWMSRAFCGIFIYRWERSFYVLMPNLYKYLRIPFIPFLNLIQAYSNIDIHYEAQIDGGITIFHPSVGIVISGKSIIGKNLSLTGGNIIGIKRKCKKGDFIIGDNCSLGANATIIGPLKLGNNIAIGASACVIKDCVTDNVTLIGVPAKNIN